MIERSRICERRTEFYGAVSFSRTRLAAAPDDDQACCGSILFRCLPVSWGFPARWRMAMVGKTEAAQGPPPRMERCRTPVEQFQCADFALLGSCSF